MSKHVVVGAGQIGRQLAALLASQGKDVAIVSRSGSGPEGVTKVRADASVPMQMVDVTAGAEAIYNCVNPPYHQWAVQWPDMANAFLAAAEKNDAVLVTLGNLYGYGDVDRPMTEDLPLAAKHTKGKVRTAMWNEALAAHNAGRIRTTEVRGSDYVGPECRDQSYLGSRFVPQVLAGDRVFYIHDPDIEHSWTYTPDVARALAVAATDERAWGKAWHIPTNSPLTARAFGHRIADAGGAPAPRITRVPYRLFDAVSVASPFLRAMRETRYQFTRPFVLDSSAFEKTFGLDPTPMDKAVQETVAWWRAQR